MESPTVYPTRLTKSLDEPPYALPQNGDAISFLGLLSEFIGSVVTASADIAVSAGFNRLLVQLVALGGVAGTAQLLFSVERVVVPLVYVVVSVAAAHALASGWYGFDPVITIASRLVIARSVYWPHVLLAVLAQTVGWLAGGYLVAIWLTPENIAANPTPNPEFKWWVPMYLEALGTAVVTAGQLVAPFAPTRALSYGILVWPLSVASYPASGGSFNILRAFTRVVVASTVSKNSEFWTWQWLVAMIVGPLIGVTVTTVLVYFSWLAPRIRKQSEKEV